MPTSPPGSQRTWAPRHGHRHNDAVSINHAQAAEPLRGGQGGQSDARSRPDRGRRRAGDPLRDHDLADDTGWVNVGIDHDTAQFAVASIHSWWQHLGSQRYPDATTLTITADRGGSNGNRTRLWKTELQRLADDTGLEIRVCHLPPGTSKWNKIEHRLFSFISRNWRAKPLVSLEVIINLIAATTTRTGLEVYAQLDQRTYPDKVRVSDAEPAAVNLHRAALHPDWNYSIKPRT